METPVQKHIDPHIETPAENLKRVLPFLFGGVLAFSFISLFIKLLAEGGYPVLFLVMARMVFGLAFISLYIAISPARRRYFKTDNIKIHFGRALAGLTAMCLVFWTFDLLPLTDGTTLHFAAPILMTVLSIPLLGEKVGPYRWAAVVIGLIGVTIILQPSGQGNLMGNAVGIAAAFGLAFSAIMIRYLGATQHPLTTVFYYQVIATCAIVPIGLFYFEMPHSATDFALMVGLGVIGAAGQYWAAVSFQRAPTAFVSPFNYFALFFAVGFDVLIWGIIPQAHTLLGAGIVILSGLIIIYREAVKNKQAKRIGGVM